ncbi:chlorophyll synthesis pathway protein BchC [Acuticoccus sp. MNP-M23]|uniref:chlorophyll synthesis pathway protein BchC n=1 Tax=Acuticoccus sp. MNP-M23 TaxID=3072793 RepID=UPI00281670BA|nr:chlorophyll synthesis pathway protein BchC [Acuticoccus sp. MNP-M23]WMS42146.1 chlorophyll synthesis pathway protein BchC [Acuticoccus sp. MNP-M23]
METLAVVLKEPRTIDLTKVDLALGTTDNRVLVRVDYSGISAGTERLLWEGAMPPFPGMGYPLVPGYETVGRVVESTDDAFRPGDAVFVPGAHCYKDVKPIFGGAAANLFCDPARLHRIDGADAQMTLLALASTAHHAIAVGGVPDLIIGHGVLGALMARITVALGHPAPTVHELHTGRMTGRDYPVVTPESDERRDYRCVVDASGSRQVIDTAVSRLARSGTITLAGFYGERLDFAFPVAFMREARIQIAAEWKANDLVVVRELLGSGALSLDGLISHVAPVTAAASAYTTAFTDPDCLKMVLNWGSVH